LIECVPVPNADGVYVTAHVEVELVATANVQVALGENAPEATPFVNVTEPAGLDFVPGSVSETVAVQVEPWLIATEFGEHDTDVEVERFVTVRAKPVASELFA
jgi:hypothetical protein